MFLKQKKLFLSKMVKVLLLLGNLLIFAAC
jgi:hypothetical protein